MKQLVTMFRLLGTARRAVLGGVLMRLVQSLALGIAFGSAMRLVAANRLITAPRCVPPLLAPRRCLSSWLQDGPRHDCRGWLRTEPWRTCAWHFCSTSG